jgi:hypothetical protein
MQRPVSDTAWALEICPASTLKMLRLYSPYKGRTGRHREARSRILNQMMAWGPVDIGDPSIRAAVVENHGGDALDSVIAASATFKTVRDPDALFPRCDERCAVEGYVYS